MFKRYHVQLTPDVWEIARKLGAVRLRSATSIVRDWVFAGMRKDPGVVTEWEQSPIKILPGVVADKHQNDPIVLSPAEEEEVIGNFSRRFNRVATPEEAEKLLHRKLTQEEFNDLDYLSRRNTT